MAARQVLRRLLKTLFIVLLLYAFLVSIKLVGSSFKLFGSDFAKTLIDSYSNPVLGLATGILATSIVQSSSTVTSLVVGLAGGGVLPLEAAIPMVMGANMGTTITNILVSLTFITRKGDFRRAFAAATIHDFFNILSIALLFPLEVYFHIIAKSAVFLTDVFKGIGGVTFTSPLKYVISPVAKGFENFLRDTLSLPDPVTGALILVVAVAVVIVALLFLVRSLREITASQTESYIDKYLFTNAFTALVLGMILTGIVQSSSITTSLIVPLVAAGVISLQKAYPFTLGANIGTTITAILASLATVGASNGGEVVTVGVTVALAHLLFNVYGVSIFLPLRRVPIFLATRLANVAAEQKRWAFTFVILMFFVLPLLIIIFAR